MFSPTISGTQIIQQCTCLEIFSNHCHLDKPSLCDNMNCFRLHHGKSLQRPSLMYAWEHLLRAWLVKIKVTFCHGKSWPATFCFCALSCCTYWHCLPTCRVWRSFSYLFCYRGNWGGKMQVLRFEVALHMVRLQPGPTRKPAHVKPYLEGTTGLVSLQNKHP